MKRPLLGMLAAPALALWLAVPAHAASQFVHQLIERPDTLGQATSLIVDAQGDPKVAYWDPQRQELHYAVKSGGLWTRESAESTDVLGLHASLALNAVGEPRVAYYNQTRGDLELASRIGGVWSVETVDSVGDVGQYASLKLDTAGNPHIAYQGSGGSLAYASRSGGAWTTETADGRTNVGNYISLALTSTGEARIAYWDGTARQLTMASRNGGVWATEVVDPATTSDDDLGRYASLALNAANEPRISYFDALNGNLKFAAKNGGTWAVETMPDTEGVTGEFTSLALDPFDQPHISYYNATRGDLEYGTKGPLGWGYQPVDRAGVVGQFTSIAVDPSLPKFPSRIAYYDATNGDLKLAVQTFTIRLGNPPDTIPNWDAIRIVDSKGDIGRYASLALDASAMPRIAYWDKSREDLRYASWNGVTFDFEVASSGGNVGQFTSLAANAAGDPLISYYDATHGDLKFATKTGGGPWQLEAVDTAGVVGLYTSLKVDANGNPHIAYRDFTNGDLKYAVRSGGTWTTTVVDGATADVGAYASLALDGQGQARIAYWDATNRLLKLASESGGSWTFETVDPAVDSGRYASLALASTGEPRISYYDALTGDLKYAARSGAVWSIERVDSAGDVGQFTSLVLNANDEPRISYYDATRQDLRFANRGNADTSWVSDIADGPGDVGRFTSLAEYVGSFEGSPRVSYRITYWDNTVGELRYSVQAYPDLHLWAYPGAYHPGAGADTILNRARTLTLRWMRDPVMEGRPDFGGYRIYRVFNDPDTTRMELIRRFSVNSADSLFMWHFPQIDETTPLSQRIATYIDPDSSGTFFKRCRRDTAGKCYSPGDSVIVLLAPPGPHDGFRTWFAITYEQRNQASSDFSDLMLNDAITCRNEDRATCPNLNHKARNITGPVIATSGPTSNLLRVSVVPNPFRGGEAWDQTGANEVHFINLPPQAKISIYTVAGDLVTVLTHSDSVHDFEPWNLKNGRGRDVSSGIYIYRVEASNFSLQDRFVVIR